LTRTVWHVFIGPPGVRIEEMRQQAATVTLLAAKWRARLLDAAQHLIHAGIAAERTGHPRRHVANLLGPCPAKSKEPKR
jgi:hypothetical protein